MINKDDFKIELPHYVKQDILIDLLIQNLSYMKSLSRFMVEDCSQRYQKSQDQIFDEFNETTKQIKYEILAFIAAKYGK
ncbi:MAG: hypothetical protein Q8933_04915 [Bacteroidota bacterium]|jgi:hypothetical protein|nr:hypothetical protein [Bacteroidota bacterium]MDP4191620.1 hypothetical protein [Bacteroidota bacterium]MDP4196344.1 hypothetical protein [Bacteroidota bacterium]